MTITAREAFRAVRKQEILSAAMAVFVRHGMDATLQDIAAEAGLTPGALYRYFDNKEALIRESFAQCFESSKVALEKTLARTDSPVETIRSLVTMSESGFNLEGARDGMILLLESILAAVRGRADEESSTLLDMDTVNSVISLVERAQEQGAIDPDVDAAGLALLVLSCLQGLQLLIVLFGDKIDTESATATLLEVIHRFETIAPGS